MNRVVIGVVIVLVGLMWPQIKEALPSIPSVVPSVQVAEVVGIVKPSSQEVLDRANKLTECVKDSEDFRDLAIFNHVFSKDLKKSGVNGQYVNDLYVRFAKKHFGSRFADKYYVERNGSRVGYGRAIEMDLIEIMGDEVSVLTEAQLLSVREYFEALAWSFANK